MLGSCPNRLDSCTPIGGACKRKPRRISHQAQEGTPTLSSSSKQMVNLELSILILTNQETTMIEILKGTSNPQDTPPYSQI